MKTVESKRKISELKTGTHLATISDMYYLKDAAGKMDQVDGCPVIVVDFRDGQNFSHIQHYIIDGSNRQKYFQNMLNASQVSLKDGNPKKDELIGKRLWISICEMHFVNDDEVVLDAEGNEKIDYFIF